MSGRTGLFDRLRRARGLFDRDGDRDLGAFDRLRGPPAVVQHTVWIVQVEVIGDVNLDLRDDHSDHADRSVTEGVRVQGDLAVQGSLRQALQASDRFAAGGGSTELARRLASLHGLVSQLVASLPADAAQAASRDLETFAKEVTSPAPRRAFYGVTAEGLVQAAKAVALLALPVAEAVEAVLSLLK
jgi:hypothetical protein